MILFLVGVMVGAIGGILTMALVIGSHTPDDDELEMEAHRRQIEELLEGKGRD